MRQYTEEMRRRSLYLAIFFTIAFITLAFFSNKGSIAALSSDEEMGSGEISFGCTEVPDI